MGHTDSVRVVALVCFEPSGFLFEQNLLSDFHPEKLQYVSVNGNVHIEPQHRQNKLHCEQE